MIVVIADDITGAAEIAGVGVRYGLKVSFCIDTFRPSESDVVVVATDTRSKSPAQAERQVERLCHAIRQAGVTQVFKKIDSVLRGHVMAEIKAAMLALERSKVLLIPANPEAGRVIDHSIYYIDGIPLDQTSFAEDPDFPARSAEVTTVLGLTKENTDEVKVPDISSIPDIEQHTAHLSDEFLPAGSAALFEAYLKQVRPGVTLHQPASYNAVEDGKTLIVCGSTHANSRRFIDQAKLRRIGVVEIPPALLSEPYNFETSAAAKHIVKQLQKRRRLIVAIKKQIIPFDEGGGQIKITLAKMVKKILEHATVQNLMIEGGATAFALINELGITSFADVEEIKKGVVRMRAGDKYQFSLTIKPGSYTWEDSLLEQTIETV